MAPKTTWDFLQLTDQPTPLLLEEKGPGDEVDATKEWPGDEVDATKERPEDNSLSVSMRRRAGG
jgi:hypothetical protein